MIRNWGIRTRVLLLALVPVICLGIVLGTYLTRVRVHDLHTSEHALGDTLANQLASASEYGVFSNNSRILQALVQAAAREPGVESVSIADRNGHILAQVTHPIPENKGFMSNAARRISTEAGLARTLLFVRPITLQPIAGSNMGELLLNNGTTPPSSDEPSHLLGAVTVKLSEAQFAARQAQIIVNGGIIMLICLALSILLALIIGGSVAVPIGRVTDMVRRFSFGEHTAQVPERSGGEIGQLERGMNQMAAHAQRSEQELQAQVNQATAELRETLEEMEVKSVELDLARKRALEASRVKSEFLSNMSHEIRTPMNAIVGFTGLLAKTHLDKDQRDYLDTVQHSAVILLALIDDVLSLQSLDAGGHIQPVTFNLRELLEQIMTLLAPEAYRKQLELILDLPADLPMNYTGDAVKISRVLINLLSNAVKFTQRGQVKLGVAAIREHAPASVLQFRVQDTGIGIRPEHIKELFKPFTMLNTASGQRYDGTGLGLAISRRLMEVLGGSLSVNSQPGIGSEFCVDLSLDILPMPPRAVSVPVPDRVLLYESQPDMAAALQSRLESLGYTVVCSHSLSGLSAHLNTGAEARFDALILSLSYREMRDYGGLHQLREDALLLPTLTLINSLETALSKQMAEATGATCLPKCVDTAALQENLRRLLRRRSSKPARKPRIRIADQAPLAGRRILVVEDNYINLRLLVMQLRGMGAEVMQAENGAAALAGFAETRPHAILLDMRLGQETGLEIARKLNYLAGAQPVPIIMLSAARDTASVEQARALGIHHWLLKPVDESTLAETLRAAVSSAAPASAAKNARLEDLQSILIKLRPEILGMLREDLPKQRDAILLAWDRNDAVALQAALHVLHGTAAMCKFPQLKVICGTLETRLRQTPQLESLATFKTSLEQEIARLIAGLAAGNHEFDSAAPPQHSHRI